MMANFQDLRTLVKSRTPFIMVESREEARALLLMQKVARAMPRLLFQWTATQGLLRLDIADAKPQSFAAGADDVLAQIRANKSASIYVLCDFHPWLHDSPVRVRQLRDIALAADTTGHTIVFLSHALTLPPELQGHAASFSLALPNENTLREIIAEEARLWSQAHPGQKVLADPLAHDMLVRLLAGLTHADAQRLARQAIVDDGAIRDADLPEINRSKFRMMNMEGVLQFEYDTRGLADIGGLRHLKQWLAIRRQPFLGGAEALLDTPRGVLLLGVQGGGKSLAARVIAGSWQVPLLRMDAGALYNKFHGETERNVRETLRLADAMSPCVLWIDEIEKAMAQDGNDNGTSSRVLGTLLTWMAERKSRVFLVATANDISRLPPELMRKGRFDEIFFVDLPDAASRADIFRIHLGKRKIPVENIDFTAVAAASERFTGAEIEQAVVSARYRAHAGSAAMTTADLLAELRETKPLAVTMAEKVEGLRRWAAERAVMAD
ncbi:MAG: AAA family ATPase [Moraxellaceae bacterium]|nr:AAA family ATPase [Moraxellaceae bacterium]